MCGVGFATALGLVSLVITVALNQRAPVIVTRRFRQDLSLLMLRSMRIGLLMILSAEISRATRTGAAPGRALPMPKGARQGIRRHAHALMFALRRWLRLAGFQEGRGNIHGPDDRNAQTNRSRINHEVLQSGVTARNKKLREFDCRGKPNEP